MRLIAIIARITLLSMSILDNVLDLITVTLSAIVIYVIIILDVNNVT